MMTDAAAGFVRWVFENYEPEDVERLEALVYSNNGASQKVVKKAGFVLEGTRRRAGWKREGEFVMLGCGGWLGVIWRVRGERNRGCGSVMRNPDSSHSDEEMTN